MSMILSEKIQSLWLGKSPTTFEMVTGFTPDRAAIPFGTVLVYGSDTKRYAAATGATIASDIAGVAINPLLKTEFTADSYEVGEWGECLIRGDIAVELSSEGTIGDATEGALVYMGVDGKLSTTFQTGEGAPVDPLPNFIFLGINEEVDDVVLVAVRKLY